MAKLVVARFEKVRDAQIAVDKLISNGYRRSSITLAEEDAARAAHRPHRPRRREASPVALGIGVVLGGYIGTCVGTIAGLYMMAEPGVGAPLFPNVPFGASAMGAAAGGALGAALGMFFGSNAMPETASPVLAESHAPGALVRIESIAGQAEAAAKFMEHCGADEVTIEDLPAHTKASAA